jgi:hypothetical protein
MPGMTSAPRKGRRDFEPVNCLNETGADCNKVQAQQAASGRAATVMSPCGLVNCKAFGPQGPSLTNRMSELLTYGFVGGVGRNPGPYPALDAAMSINLHFGRHWRRASEAGRYCDTRLCV